jgi:AbrB family looped-hinge helix DNA binding protein
MNDILEESVIYGTVKIGERGQVVIPSRARNEFHIKPCDLLLVVRAPNTRGIGLALLKADLVKEFMERVMKGMEIRGSRRAKRE